MTIVRCDPGLSFSGHCTPPFVKIRGEKGGVPSIFFPTNVHWSKVHDLSTPIKSPFWCVLSNSTPSVNPASTIRAHPVSLHPSTRPQLHRGPCDTWSQKHSIRRALNGKAKLSSVLSTSLQPCLLLILPSSLKATWGLLETVAERWLCPYTGLGDVTLPSTVSSACYTGAHVALLVPDRSMLIYPQPPAHGMG